MINQDPEERVARMLEDLGPADPPASLVGNVMARISLDARHQTGGRVIPFHQGEMAMTRKAMWGVAAAAAVLLGVFVFRGFPPVGHGTEGTVGAAKKYEAPQIAAKDVVVGDAAVQEFLQSAEFDQLMKDPEARSLINSAELRPHLKDAAVVDAISRDDVRQTLVNKAVADLFADAAARKILENDIKASVAGAEAAKKAAADSAAHASARAMVSKVMSDNVMAAALRLDAVRSLLDDAGARAFLQSPAAAAALRGTTFAKVAARPGFKEAAVSGRLSSALARN